MAKKSTSKRKNGAIEKGWFARKKEEDFFGVNGSPNLAWAVVVFAGFAIAGSALVICFSKDDGRHEIIRNILYSTAISGALVGGWLAQRRNKAYDKEVALQGEQQRIEALSRAIEQIGNLESDTICLAGIRVLENLGKKNKNDTEFIDHLCDILQSFLGGHVDKNEKNDSVTRAQGKRNRLRQNSTRIFTAFKVFDVLQEFKSKKGRGVNLTSAFLSGAKLADSQLRGAVLYFANLQGTYLGRSNLENAVLVESNLEKAHLHNVNLNNVVASEANLTAAMLDGASLCGAHLHRANLSRANLALAKLKDAHLDKANLKKALFLFPSDEKGLDGVNLADAILDGAIYYETKEDYRKNISQKSLTLAKLVTREWLKSQGAKNVDLVKGVPENEANISKFIEGQKKAKDDKSN